MGSGGAEGAKQGRALSVGRLRLRPGAVVAVLVAIAVVVYLLASSGGGTQNPHPLRKTVAAVSEQGLKTLAKVLRYPIYWAGPRTGVTYEVTQISNGELFVRYLPSGVRAGTKVQYPLVATFPFANAYGATLAAADMAGAVKLRLTTDAIAFYDRSRPTNVYLAFRGSDYQIEVFSPSPSQARAWVTGNQIQPVSASVPGAVAPASLSAASLAQLRALPARLGHPVYWIGPHARTTYELTRTATGEVFIRYLPAGTPIGTDSRYPFVATFVVAKAFKTTTTAASAAGSVRIPATGRAVAFYARTRPTNVYLAFPGSKVQIEIFDPSPKLARALVKSGHVAAIR